MFYILANQSSFMDTFAQKRGYFFNKKFVIAIICMFFFLSFTWEIVQWEGKILLIQVHSRFPSMHVSNTWKMTNIIILPHFRQFQHSSCLLLGMSSAPESVGWRMESISKFSDRKVKEQASFVAKTLWLWSLTVRP